jgi:hypothetical protein
MLIWLNSRKRHITWRRITPGRTVFILPPVYGSVTNNNGAWIAWLDLLTPSFTISFNHNQLQPFIINYCVRLAPLWLNYVCILLQTTPHVRGNAFLSERPLIESSGILGKCLLLPQQRSTFQQSTSFIFASVATFVLTPSDGLCLRIVYL